MIDTADQVAALALEMIEARLAAGDLKIDLLTVRVCVRCSHLTGAGDRACRACEHPVTRPHRARHLIAERGPAGAVLSAEDFSAHARRQPAHLRQIAGNVPSTLILSRTRDHGIGLGPIGLEGLVLDPRVGVHVTVLAAGRARQDESTVMTTTANAAANIAAYGRHFRRYQGCRLRYALHGHLPYQQLSDLHTAYAAHHLDAAARALFETWFLPLVALKEKSGVPADQLPALLKHFHRSRLRGPSERAEVVLAGLRGRIRVGDTDWISSRGRRGRRGQ